MNENKNIVEEKYKLISTLTFILLFGGLVVLYWISICLGTSLLIIAFILLPYEIYLFLKKRSKDKREKSNHPSTYSQKTQQLPQSRQTQQSSSPPPTPQKTQSERGQEQEPSPPPPSPKNCPDCNADMRYIKEHERWWCDRCQEYK